MDVVPVDKLTRMIERKMLPASALTWTLLEYCSCGRGLIPRLFEAIGRAELHRVYDMLSLFPHTNCGWAILPVARKEYLRPDLSHQEESDIYRRQFQEDREHVEYLRELIRHATQSVNLRDS